MQRGDEDIPPPFDKSDKRLSVTRIKPTNFDDIPHLVSPEAAFCGDHNLIPFSALNVPLLRNKFGVGTDVSRRDIPLDELPLYTPAR